MQELDDACRKKTLYLDLALICRTAYVIDAEGEIVGIFAQIIDQRCGTKFDQLTLAKADIGRALRANNPSMIM